MNYMEIVAKYQFWETYNSDIYAEFVIICERRFPLFVYIKK